MGTHRTMTSSLWPAAARSSSSTDVAGGRRGADQPGPAIWPARRTEWTCRFFLSARAAVLVPGGCVISSVTTGNDGEVLWAAPFLVLVELAVPVGPPVEGMGACSCAVWTTAVVG